MTVADAERFSKLELRLTVEVGRTRITLAELASMQPGAIVMLGSAGHALDVRLGDVSIADGASMQEGARLGVRLLALRLDEKRR